MSDRRQQICSEALESSIWWANLAIYHRGVGEVREAVRAEQCAENARRYAEMLQERIDGKVGA